MYRYLLHILQERTSCYGATASAGMPGLGSAELGGTLEREIMTTFDTVKKEGFCRMPFQGLCSFKPNCKDTDTIYITAVYFDNKGVEHLMAENVPHAVSHKAIITSAGFIVDAESLEAGSWLDKSGNNHKTTPCETCISLGSLCTACLLESRLGVIQKSIGVVRNCPVADTLNNMLEKIGNDKIAKKEGESNV